ncbi:MAG TPA: hypothetical protein VKH36_05445 [Acidimicrobiia bacterium]|nr:hypothetical protein [Acidimicrobiia bacterium]
MIAVVLVVALLVGGAVGITYLVTSGGSSGSGRVDVRAATTRACETAVRVQSDPQGLATGAQGARYTYPARYQVEEVVDAFHADGVPAALVREADQLDRASRGGPSVSADVQLDRLVCRCRPVL